MIAADDHFKLKLAETPDELKAAQRLRYEVFVEELGSDGELVDHEARLEKDAYDPFYDHLLLLDESRPFDMQVVGVYRLLRQEQAERIGQFYTESEFDLTPIKSSGRRLLELGRSCLHRDYRGGMAMHHIWNGIGDYVLKHEIEILFGVASFHGTDVQALAQPLSFLHHNHLAPEDMRVTVLADNGVAMDVLPVDQVDRREAMLATPALIKAYLRVGGFVGQGAYVDHAFNTVDVCLLMDTERMTAKAKARYTQGAGL
ncbi:GNAT family N-acetyltransferase [Actibacterium pelagium]|uniref:L-ornithine N(alpha)-acyltransferase n=1 Tax=Actibacterium pelagium TaxID=2029103 RepID=A0A917EHU2_9RHOB|nr:GNAT family N-acyltransferase [Actibacterium pelagium]GGE44074.1 ornithine-acyl-ACP acyltransferase [Actibacterium pelagium]